MNHRLLRTFFGATLTLALFTMPTWAQGNGKGKAKGHDKQQGEDDQGHAWEKYGFRTRDREVVTTYYSKHGSGLPPGLAKRNGSLPPRKSPILLPAHRHGPRQSLSPHL